MPVNYFYFNSDGDKLWIDKIKRKISPYETTTTAEITIEGVVNEDVLKKLCGRYVNAYGKKIKKIYVNEKKKTVVVVFNGEFSIHNKNYDPKKDDKYHKYTCTNKIKVKCNEEEVFDVYKAVSAACMIKNYGSNSAFKSHIRKTTGVYSDSLYDTMARYLTSVMFDSWDNFVKAVDEVREDSHGKRKETNAR